MRLEMFKALLPYYGGKRRLCPIIFRHIANHFPRDKWQGAVFVDAFLGSGAVSLYAKAQGFRIVANDAAERSYLAGKALIENNQSSLRTTTWAGFAYKLLIRNGSLRRNLLRMFSRANTPHFWILLLRMSRSRSINMCF